MAIKGVSNPNTLRLSQAGVVRLSSLKDSRLRTAFGVAMWSNNKHISMVIKALLTLDVSSGSTAEIFVPIAF